MVLLSVVLAFAILAYAECVHADAASTKLNRLLPVIKNDGRTISSSLAGRMSNIPARGPLPSDVKPAPNSQFDSVPVPIVNPVCRNAGVPIVTINSFEDFTGDPQFTWFIGAEARWCRQARPGVANLRVRVLSFRRERARYGPPVTRTAVLAAEVLRNDGGEGFFAFETRIPRPCRDFQIYVEFCARNPSSDVLVCATSELSTVERSVVPEPELRFRPPIKLELAPGDRAVVRTLVFGAEARFKSELSNGISYPDDAMPALQGVVTRKNKSVARTTTRRVAKSIAVRIPSGKGGVRLQNNGSIVYASYGTSSCPATSDSWLERYPTTILIRNSFKSLVRQDSKLPTILKQPTFPPTQLGKQFELTVEAMNNGRGMLNGGGTPPLHYQWYRREAVTNRPEYAEPIPGATGSTLMMEAGCFGGSNDFGILCGGSASTQCSDVGFFSVDVCNTFGCRRSEVAEANVLPPPPEVNTDCILFRFN